MLLGAEMLCKEGKDKRRTAGPGSGVMEACEARRSVYDVSAGENVGFRYILAITIT